MSSTPRTDKEVIASLGLPVQDAWTHMIRFAKELERELQEVKKE